jgi:hypothetical protein
MRRKRAMLGVLLSTRSGVTANTMHKNRKAQSPVARISASCGLAPNWSATAR